VISGGSISRPAYGKELDECSAPTDTGVVALRLLVVTHSHEEQHGEDYVTVNKKHLTVNSIFRNSFCYNVIKMRIF
jgi:hypothetical protein